MTRPQSRNGFGLSVQDVDSEVALIEAGMELLPDSPALYREWRRIVVQFAVSGVQVHDARLAASMYTMGSPTSLRSTGPTSAALEDSPPFIRLLFEGCLHL
jgi:hypothetical protein